MNIFSLLSFFAFINYLYIGIYAFKLDSKLQLNRTFFALCLNLAIWSFSNIFFYSAPNKEICWFWYNISSVGWCIFPGIALHFYLVLTKKETILKKWWTYPVLYMPGIIFIYKVFTGIFITKDLIQKSFGWFEVDAPDSIWYWSYIIYLSYIIVGILLTWQWGNKSKILREKKQAKIILFTTMLAFVVASISGIVLPAIKIYIIPPIEPILILIWIFGICYAIAKYKLMIFTPAIASDEIISKIMDLLVLVNPEGNIIKVNRQIEELLECKEEELVGKPLSKIVLEEENRNEIIKMKEGLSSCCNYELTFKTKNGDNIPANISVSAIMDNAGDEVGVIVVGQDIRLTKQLQKEIAERKQVEETLRESEAKYRAVFENTGTALTILEEDTTISLANTEFLRLSGYSREEMEGKKSWTEFVAKDELERMREYHRLRRIDPGTALKDYEFKFVDRNGNIKIILLSVDVIPGTKRSIASLRDVTVQKMAEEQLRYLSLHDHITGLFNRAYFEQEMRRLEEGRCAPVGIIVCDVDGLKLINDTLGHDTGDVLLVTAAGIIRESFRESVMVARIGGDEFAILLPNSESIAVESASHRIRDAVARYNAVNPEIPLSISVGFAVSSEASTSMVDLFKEADNNMYREKLHRNQSVRSSIVQALMKALKARDFITEGHADRLQVLTADLALAVGLPEHKLTDLRLLAQFHDIGKVGLPDRILFKPGPLTSEETSEMQRHSEIGHRIAQSISDLVPIADWVLKHHEWWNGKGYPLGLKEEEIPLECRILAIADAYDAMTSDRPYRKALSHEKALAELRKYSGIQFDPQLVPKFIQVLQQQKLKALKTAGAGLR